MAVHRAVETLVAALAEGEMRSRRGYPAMATPEGVAREADAMRLRLVPRATGIPVEAAPEDVVMK